MREATRARRPPVQQGFAVLHSSERTLATNFWRSRARGARPRARGRVGGRDWSEPGRPACKRAHEAHGCAGWGANARRLRLSERLPTLPSTAAAQANKCLVDGRAPCAGGAGRHRRPRVRTLRPRRAQRPQAVLMPQRVLRSAFLASLRAGGRRARCCRNSEAGDGTAGGVARSRGRRGGPASGEECVRPLASAPLAMFLLASVTRAPAGASSALSESAPKKADADEFQVRRTAHEACTSATAICNGRRSR